MFHTRTSSILCPRCTFLLYFNSMPTLPLHHMSNLAWRDGPTRNRLCKPVTCDCRPCPKDRTDIAYKYYICWYIIYIYIYNRALECRRRSILQPAYQIDHTCTKENCRGKNPCNMYEYMNTFHETHQHSLVNSILVENIWFVCSFIMLYGILI